MTHEDIVGIAALIIVSPILINHTLDFFIPGRWERRAYKRSVEDLHRWIRKRNK